jgi:fluoride ion exporter CrcB/FEX
MDGLTRLLFTLALSIASFDLGVHLGKRFKVRLPIPSPSSPSARWIITLLSIAVYVLTIPLFVHLNHSWRPLATAALMFSFIGTLSRYILSAQLNRRFKVFPLGTLLANEIATAVLAMCHIVQRDPSPPSPVACSILQGLIDGYCGCMSTVSTFASEVRTLQGKRSWQYVAVSLGLGQAILLVTLGPAWWTGRIKDNNVCNAN